MPKSQAPRRRRPRGPRGVGYPDHFPVTLAVVGVFVQGAEGATAIVVFNTEVVFVAGGVPAGWAMNGAPVVTVIQTSPTTLQVEPEDAIDHGVSFEFPATTRITTVAGGPYAGLSGTVS